MLDPKMPLWLPSGSVRSLIALAFTVAGLIALFSLADVPEWFALLLGIIIRDYFQSRNTEEVAKVQEGNQLTE